MNTRITLRRYLILLIVLISVLTILNQIVLRVRLATLFGSGQEYPTPIASVEPPPGSVYEMTSTNSNITDICVNIYPGQFPELGEAQSKWRSLLLINHRPIFTRPKRALPLMFVTNCWSGRLVSGRSYVADFVLWNPSYQEIFTYSWAFSVSK